MAEKNKEKTIIQTQKPREKIIFIKPKYRFNFIEKMIRTNPKYAKLFSNTKYIRALTNDTEDIPNSIYLIKINQDETILDKLLKDNQSIFSAQELEKRIEEDPRILESYLKNNISPLNRESSDEFIIMTLDYVLKNIGYDWHENNIDLIQKTKNNKKIYDIVFNYFIEKETLEISEKYIIEVLINKSTPEKKLKFYQKHINNFKKNIEDPIFKRIFYENMDENIIKYLVETKQYNLLENIDNTDKLNTKIDENNSLFSLLIEKEILKVENNYYRIDTFIKTLIDNNMYCGLKNIIKKNYDILLMKYEDTTILEMMLDKYKIFPHIFLGKEIEKKLWSDIRYAKSYVKYGGWYKLLNASNNVLDSKYDEKSTIFEQIIKQIEQHIDYNFIGTIIGSSPISKRILLHKYKNKTVLETLLQNNKKETLDCLFMNKIYKDAEIQTILKLNGIDIDKEFQSNNKTIFDIDEALETQKNEIIKEKFKKYSESNIAIEKQKLIDELKRVFMEDGRSDEIVIDLACDSFKSLFINNYEYAERDLKNLINIKNNNPEFIMIKDDYSHFDSMGLIGIKKIYNVDTFNHELTHAMHWYITKNRIPDTFKNMIIEINEKNFQTFVNEFAAQKIITIEILDDIDFYTMNKEAKKDSKEYRKRIENILENAEKNKSYSKEIIDYLKDNITVEEEYKKYYNKEARLELSVLYQKDYIYSIIDIIDALKRGKIYENGIKINEITVRIGHGEEYYNTETKAFEEIFAEYIEIKKSEYSEEAIEILESIVGRELIDVLEEFNKELFVEQIENVRQK